MLLEAGHVAQNICLLATEKSLGSLLQRRQWGCALNAERLRADAESAAACKLLPTSGIGRAVLTARSKPSSLRRTVLQ